MKVASLILSEMLPEAIIANAAKKSRTLAIFVRTLATFVWKSIVQPGAQAKIRCRNMLVHICDSAKKV